MLRLPGAHSTLEVSPQGAHVTDWTMHGSPPVLFLSPRSVFQRGKAIRGGVPLVFPWFGPTGPGRRSMDSPACATGAWRLRRWSPTAPAPWP